MSSFLGKIRNIFKLDKRRRKYYFPLFFVFLLIFFVYKISPANAGLFEWVTDNTASAFGNLITLICWGTVKLFVQLTIWASEFFIAIASYNDFINSRAVILGWVLVRDVVNMFFVVILLVIAFATVLGVEQYEWKKLMVKLLFAAVLINFSRVICGVIIDVAQVFTMTFVNGFAATASGNVMNALKLSEGFKLSTQAEAQKTTDLNYLLAAMAAAFFAVLSFFVLGAYAFIMTLRVVTLWVLIVLSPIAFISSVLPATQKYSSEWWKQFNNHVLAGPILAFFFWLSFAVVGNGDIINEVDKEGKLSTSYKQETGITSQFKSPSAGVSELLEWPTIGSFVIAIALLMVGVEKTQELGVRGAGMLSSAMATAKKVGMYATGIRAAGWVSRKAPLVGTESWIRRGKGIKARFETSRQDLMMKWDKMAAEGLKSSEKAGGPGGFVGKMLYGAILSPAQKEKQLKMLEDQAGFAKKEREEKFSLGTTKLGLETGRRYMRTKLTEEEMNKGKITGLAIAEAEELRAAGKFDEADAALENAQAKVDKLNAEKFAGLSFDSMKLRMSERVEKRKQAQKKYESATTNEEKEKYLKEYSDSSKEVVSLYRIAVSRGGAEKNAMENIILGEQKGRKLKDASKRMSAIATGINTSGGEGQQKSAEVYAKFKEADASGWSVAMTDLKKKGEELAEKTGDISVALGISTGVAVDKNGFKKVVADIGSNVGTEGFDGKERKGQKLNEVDAEREKYLRDVMKYRVTEPLTADSLASETIDRDDPNQKVSFDDDKTAVYRRNLAESSPAMLGKILGTTLKASLEQLILAGKIENKTLAHMLNELKKGREGDDRWVAAFEDSLGDKIINHAAVEKNKGDEKYVPQPEPKRKEARDKVVRQGEDDYSDMEEFVK